MQSILKSDVTLEVLVQLNESEIRALDALAGYGTDHFLEAFYKVMGESYLKPHSKGIRSLFARVTDLQYEMGKVDEMRKAFHEIDKKSRS